MIKYFNKLPHSITVMKIIGIYGIMDMNYLGKLEEEATG